MLRLFVAVTLPPPALEGCARERERIERALGTDARAMRFPRPEGIHFTLKFLGWVPEGGEPAIREGLEQAAAKSAPFEVVLKGLHAFPSPRRPRVVYLDASEGGRAMSELALLVEEQIAPLGFPSEKRGFTPHATLARVSDPKAAMRVGPKLSALDPMEVARFQVTDVELMLSELSPGGSIYTSRARFALGAPA